MENIQTHNTGSRQFTETLRIMKNEKTTEDVVYVKKKAYFEVIILKCKLGK